MRYAIYDDEGFIIEGPFTSLAAATAAHDEYDSADGTFVDEIDDDVVITTAVWS